MRPNLPYLYIMPNNKKEGDLIQKFKSLAGKGNANKVGKQLLEAWVDWYEKEGGKKQLQPPKIKIF